MLPALVIEPCWRRSPEEYSEGIRPKNFISSLGVSKRREVANFGHHGDGHGELHTAQGLKGFDHRVQTPGLHVLLEFLFETLEAFGVFADGSDIFLKDDLLRRCGADHFREPPEMGRAPSGPAGVADIVSEQEGFESKLGVLEIAEGIFTCPGEVSNGFIFHLGDIDRGEITRARQAGQLHGVPAVGFDAVTGLFGNE